MNKRKILRLVAVLTPFLFSHMLDAHEMRPAYLEIVESEQHVYQVYWKVPRKAGLRLAIQPTFPVGFSPSSAVQRSLEPNAIIEQWEIRSEERLAGKELKIDGLETTFTDVLVRIKYSDGKSTTIRLTADKPGFELPVSPSIWSVAWTYFVLGVEHILLGIDHLLFVLTLLFIVDNYWKLVKTITAFTVAHSITLIIATLDIVTIPGPPVEALIALSIVLVAQEIIRKNQGKSSLTEQQPWLVAFGFGLLHGFGFAGALSEVGLPQQDIPMSLLTFNLGVEAGQLIFVFASVALAFAFKSVVSLFTQNTKESTPRYSAAIRVLVTYCVGIIAAYWFVERVSGFF